MLEGSYSSMVAWSPASGVTRTVIVWPASTSMVKLSVSPAGAMFDVTEGS